MQNAFDQAKARLARANKAIEAFSAATKIEEAEEAWTDFLLAAATIYSKLEQGAKGNPKSQTWFGNKKKERKSDPLLRYLHFARNSNEHGIERVAETTPPNYYFQEGRQLKFNERIPTKFQKVDPATNQPTGDFMDGMFAGPTLRPVRAHDRRFGDYCDPPDEHLGQTVEYGISFCYDIGVIGLRYLTRLISEAEQLPPS
jgi:hypothetical protein